MPRRKKGLSMGMAAFAWGLALVAAGPAPAEDGRRVEAGRAGPPLSAPTRGQGSATPAPYEPDYAKPAWNGDYAEPYGHLVSLSRVVRELVLKFSVRLNSSKAGRANRPLQWKKSDRGQAVGDGVGAGLFPGQGLNAASEEAYGIFGIRAAERTELVWRIGRFEASLSGTMDYWDFDSDEGYEEKKASDLWKFTPLAYQRGFENFDRDNMSNWAVLFRVTFLFD